MNNIEIAYRRFACSYLKACERERPFKVPVATLEEGEKVARVFEEMGCVVSRLEGANVLEVTAQPHWYLM